jgi:hypothetical protein
MASLFGQVFPAAGGGGSVDLQGYGDTSKYVMGTGVTFAVDGEITGVWFYITTDNLPSNGDFGVGVVEVGFGVYTVWEAESLPASGQLGTWVLYTLTTPVAVAAGESYMVCVRTNRYAYAGQRFATDYVNGDLTGYASDTGAPNGAFAQGGGADGTPPSSVPNGQFNRTFYGIDVEFTPAGGSTPVSGTDAGTQTDAAGQIAADQSRTDTGALTDAGTPGPVLARTDTATQTEGAPAVAGGTTDPAALTDGSALTATVGGTETGTETGTGTVGATGSPVGADAATSSEASSIATAGTGLDLVVLGEVATLLAGAVAADTAAQTDAPGLIATEITAADLVTAADAGALAVVLPAADLAAAVDAGIVTVTGGSPAGSDAMAMASTATVATTLAGADVAVLVLEDSDLYTIGPYVRDISPRARLVAASATLLRLPSAILYDVRRR